MAKPPPSGPHSDISGVNMDARVGVPTREQEHDAAEEVANADADSHGQPDKGEAASEPGRTDG